MQDVAAHSDDERRLSAGTLYAAIERMVEQGPIIEIEKCPRRADSDRRRYYRITGFGTADARAESRRLAQLVRHGQACGLTREVV